ncbi:MAG: EAL domain-containing protein [Burkholderiaceae bacterium]|nr:EAL domain-containing protein [Burkholderiaceae bacterium]
MSRLGVVSLASLTLVAFIALHDSPREATHAQTHPNGAATGASANDSSAPAHRQNIEVLSETETTSRSDPWHYATLFIAFAAGGTAAAFVLKRLNKFRRQPPPSQPVDANADSAPDADTSDIVTVHDEAGYIRYASSGLLDLGGYSVSGLVGRRGRDLVHPDDFGNVLDAVRAARTSSETEPTRFRCRTRGGDYIWLEARFTHVLSRTGERQFTARAICIATSTRSTLALLEHEMPWSPTAVLAADAQRYSLSGLIRESLKRKEFELHYQLKVSLENWEVTGAEALLRWNVPAGLGRTAEIVAEAERSGLIIPLGEWVVRTAAQQSLRWRRSGRDYPISVNISPLQLRDPNFVGLIRGLLSEDRQLPQYLQLEVTEQALASNDDDSIRSIAQLAALGFVLHIDDFGTGISQLSQLSRIPVGALKVDRELVRRLPHGANSSATMMDAIAAVSRSLHIKVIAEGVETSDELEALRGYGVDEVQGFLLGRPMTAKSIVDLSSTNARSEKCTQDGG